MSSLLQRARESGRFPPSLICDGKLVNEDGFENAVMQILDIKGTLRATLQGTSYYVGCSTICLTLSYPVLSKDFSLSSDSKVAESFASIVQVSWTRNLNLLCWVEKAGGKFRAGRTFVKLNKWSITNGELFNAHERKTRHWRRIDWMIVVWFQKPRTAAME